MRRGTGHENPAFIDAIYLAEDNSAGWGTRAHRNSGGVGNLRRWRAHGTGDCGGHRKCSRDHQGASVGCDRFGWGRECGTEGEAGTHRRDYGGLHGHHDEQPGKGDRSHRNKYFQKNLPILCKYSQHFIYHQPYVKEYENKCYTPGENFRV